MNAKPNTCGAFIVLLPVDFKIVTNFKKKKR